MRILATTLVVGLVLAAGAAFAATENWMGLLWEDQPIPGYTSAAANVDIPTNQMHISSGSGVSKTTFVPGSPGEKTGTVKLTSAVPIDKIYARVYDPVYGSNSGWVIYMIDDGGKWLGLGRCTWDKTGYVSVREYNGSAWTRSDILSRGTDPNNYFANTLVQQPDGTVSISIDWYKGGATGITTASTTLSYGTFTSLYLWASTSSTDYQTYKWTDFQIIPEPSSLLALAAGLPIVGFAIRRRKG